MPRQRHEETTDPWQLLEVYRERYQIDHLLGQVESLERSIEHRRRRQSAVRRRLEDLERQLAQATADLEAVEAEIRGSCAVGALLIEDILDRVREEHDERWSPAPVRGFRVWRIKSGAIWGNQVVWEGPTLISRCLRSVPGEDVPHSVRRCGPPSCGIYAVKSLNLFPDDIASCEFGDTAVGVVALAGKVVEHELGYRAQRAAVVAIAINHAGRRLVTKRKRDIRQLFQDPAGAVDRLEKTTDSSPDEARAFLEAAQQEEAWI